VHFKKMDPTERIIDGLFDEPTDMPSEFRIDEVFADSIDDTIEFEMNQPEEVSVEQTTFEHGTFAIALLLATSFGIASQM